MSNIPLTEINLQSLQRSQQYASIPTGGSGLVDQHGTNGILLDSMAMGGKDLTQAALLTPDAADNIIAELLQQYFHVQEWQVPWPRPKTTPLLYVPDTLTAAFDVPKAPTAADLDAMSLGLVESIPFVHDLLYPEQERVRTQLSKEVSQSQHQIAAQGLHPPHQTAKERNPQLPDEDFALIDVDFCSSGHGQRHLPSITFLQRPSYTEIGLAPAQRREEERRMSVAQQMPSLLNASSVTPNGSVGAPASQYNTDNNNTSGSSAVSQWNVLSSRTFKNAKQLDLCYSQWISQAASRKLGLLPAGGSGDGGSRLTADVIARLTSRILSLIAYITANGVVLGSRRNDTNQTFYNQQQGKLVGGIVWKYLCSIAAEAWGQWNNDNNNNNNTPRLLKLPASTIVARILDDANVDTLALGATDTKELLAKTLEDVFSQYCTALKQTIVAAKIANVTECPLAHTSEDFVSFNGLPTEILPDAVSRVAADASSLAQRPIGAYEKEVESSLRLASNISLHPTLSMIADAGESARRQATAAHLAHDEELLGMYKTNALVKPNGAVPLAVMPVFPDGFTRIAKDITASTYTHDFANAHRTLQHVVLNGERNGFIPGAYIPSDARTPNVLFNDRLHFRPIADPAAAVGSKRTRRGGSNNNNNDTDDSTTAYTTGTAHSKFEKYLADQSSTISYIMKVVQPTDDDDNADGDNNNNNNVSLSAVNNGAPIVTYSRVPTLTRYKRAQTRISSDDILKTVSVSWVNNDDAAREEQLSLAEDAEETEGQETAAAEQN